MAPAADGRTPPVRCHRLQHSNQELLSVLDALPAAPARVQRAVGQFCKSRAGICAVRIMHATQDGCAEAPRRALPGTEARDTRCGQSPLLRSCHLPHHGVRYAAECCQYAAERASILAPERCCDDRSLSSAKEGSQTSTFSRRKFCMVNRGDLKAGKVGTCRMSCTSFCIGCATTLRCAYEFYITLRLAYLRRYPVLIIPCAHTWS